MDLPVGIRECAAALRNVHLTYKYTAFYSTLQEIDGDLIEFKGLFLKTCGNFSTPTTYPFCSAS